MHRKVSFCSVLVAQSGHIYNKMLSSIVYFFLDPVGFSFKMRNSSEKGFNLLFITDLNNLPNQLKIVLGQKFLGSVFAPFFL